MAGGYWGRFEDTKTASSEIDERMTLLRRLFDEKESGAGQKGVWSGDWKTSREIDWNVEKLAVAIVKP